MAANSTALFLSRVRQPTRRSGLSFPAPDTAAVSTASFFCAAKNSPVETGEFFSSSN